MAWESDIVDVRAANLRANQAELTREWHMAAHNYLFCLERAALADDRRAVRFFAGRLSHVYRAMGMISKADHFSKLLS